MNSTYRVYVYFVFQDYIIQKLKLLRTVLNAYIINDLTSIIFNYIGHEKPMCKNHKKIITNCCLSSSESADSNYLYKDRTNFLCSEDCIDNIKPLNGIPLLSLTESQKNILHIDDSYIKNIMVDTSRYLDIVLIYYPVGSDDSDYDDLVLLSDDDSDSDCGGLVLFCSDDSDDFY